MLKETFTLNLLLTHSCYIMKVRGLLAESKVKQATMNRPAPVELCHKNMRFLITHNPTDSTLNSFIEVGVNSECHKEITLLMFKPMHTNDIVLFKNF